MAHVVFRDPGIAYLVRAVATSVSMPVSSDGAALTITSGTVTAYKPDGTSLGQTACTISGGIPSVSLNLSASNDYGAGYRLDWSLTHAGGTEPVYSQPAVLCRAVPRATYGHLDVIEERPTLTDYPGSQTTWTPQCEAAWREFLASLTECAGHRLDQVLTWEQTRKCLRLCCLMHIHRARATYTGSTSDRRAESAEDAYQDAFQALRLKLDTDDDGVSEDEFSGARIEWPGRSGRRVS